MFKDENPGLWSVTIFFKGGCKTRSTEKGFCGKLSLRIRANVIGLFQEHMINVIESGTLAMNASLVQVIFYDLNDTLKAVDTIGTQNNY